VYPELLSPSVGSTLKVVRSIIRKIVPPSDVDRAFVLYKHKTFEGYLKTSVSLCTQRKYFQWKKIETFMKEMDFVGVVSEEEQKASKIMNLIDSHIDRLVEELL